MKALLRSGVFIAASTTAVFAQTPAVVPGGVLNGASFSKGQAVAPGSLVAIFGTDLASSLAQADSIPLSTALAGVSVTFNNVAAPLQFVNHDPANGDQVNAQLPWNIQGNSAQVVVQRGSGVSAPQTFAVTPAAPGIFAVNFGVGQAIAYGNADGIVAAAPNAVPGLTTHPARIGDPNTLVILATGLGAVDPPVQTGNVPTDGQLHKAVVQPEVLVGGMPAQVMFAGLTSQFVGVYQINIIVAPGTPTGNAVPLQLRMNGITTTDQVTIAVSN